MLARIRSAHLRRPWLAILVLSVALTAAVSAWLLLDDPDASLGEIPQYNSFHGASEFVVGENRFPFALASFEGEPLADAAVSVSFYHLQDSEWQYRFRRDADYREVEGVTPHLHDDGFLHKHLDVRGQYVAKANFQSTGVWQARFSLSDDEESAPTVGDLAFNVLSEPTAPGVGEPAPLIETPTIHHVASIDEIESRDPTDGMHVLSVSEAIKQEKPFVVIWSAPMFCTSAICGPVLEAAVRVQEKLGNRVNFIHIEPWDLKIAREEGRLIPIPEFTGWGLTTEPWIFVVDARGIVYERFEGLVTDAELEQAVMALLTSTT